MSYLIIGSNSFAGATFVNELLCREERVIGISRSPQPNVILRPYANHPLLKNFTFYQCDLNQHFPEVNDLILKYKPKYIIDFANQGMVAESWLHPEHWYTTNILAKVKLHQLLRNCDFLNRYIRISTPEVYGNLNEKLTEKHTFNPTTPYAVSQAATDMSLNAFYKQYNFPVIFTRFANFYGPGQQLYRIIPKVIIYAMIKKKFPLHGGGSSRRAFIYGTDIANAISFAIDKGKIGDVYHFSTEECIAISALVQTICQLLEIKYEDFIEQAPERPGKDAQYFMDIQKSKQELGWQPLVKLEQGLRYTIDWVKRNIETIIHMPIHYQHKI